MTWPEAFVTVGVAMAVALVVYSICRWGDVITNPGLYSPHGRVDRRD
ncbi:hypothetical protein NF840_005071 [Escherichia coli]|nr:hypothetical protein [Escherichia coli]